MTRPGGRFSVHSSAAAGASPAAAFLFDLFCPHPASLPQRSLPTGGHIEQNLRRDLRRPGDSNRRGDLRRSASVLQLPGSYPRGADSRGSGVPARATRRAGLEINQTGGVKAAWPTDGNPCACQGGRNGGSGRMEAGYWRHAGVGKRGPERRGMTLAPGTARH